MRAALVLSAIVVGLLVFSIVPGSIGSALGAIGSADSVGSFSPFYFESDYVFTWSGYDCIEARLYFNSILQASESIGCYSSGSWFGYLYAAPAAGTYQLQLWSTYNGVSEYSKSWTTPGYVMTVSVSASSANAGDTVGIMAKFTLSSAGPDYLNDFGRLNVTAGSRMTDDVGFTDVSAHYFNFYGLTPTVEFEETIFLVPVSFGIAGSQTIPVQFSDPFSTASGSVSITVSDPLAVQISAIQAELDSLSSNESADATRLAQLSGEIAALAATTSANDTQDRAALAALAAEVSELWAKLNNTQASASSVQSAMNVGSYESAAAVVMGAAGLALGAMAYRRSGRKTRD